MTRPCDGDVPSFCAASAKYSMPSDIASGDGGAATIGESRGISFGDR